MAEKQKGKEKGKRTKERKRKEADKWPSELD